MLDLDSERWGQIHHAYGPAVDTPSLLRQLRTAPIKSADRQREPWFSLWSSLCHQSDVYPASYAALPHIVAAAQERQPENRAEYLVLAGTIECMRHKPSSPPVPSDLEPPYFLALQAAVVANLEALRAETDPSWFQGLVASFAAFRGFPKLGAGIADLEGEVDCPACGATFAARGYEYFE